MTMFGALSTITQAKEILLSHSELLPVEEIEFDHLLHRFLRENITATEDQPAFDKSALDGYALSADSQEGRWKIVQEIPAGGKAEIALRAGECARVLTGALVPVGTAQVVAQEWVSKDALWIKLEKELKAPGIRRQGDDNRQGDILLRAGNRLGATELAVLAQQGVSHAIVSRHPRLIHLVIGDELVGPTEPTTGSSIRDTNSPLIAALAEEFHLPRLQSVRVKDDFSAAHAALEKLSWQEADVLLISGGAGHGDRDISLPLLESLGFVSHIRGVNMRPGKPFTATFRKGQAAFILPGNPVAHWVVWHVFVKTFLAEIMGAIMPSDTFPLSVAEDWSCGDDGRALRWPARVETSPDGQVVRPLLLASSGDLSKLTGANALIHLSSGMAQLEKGDIVQVEWA